LENMSHIFGTKFIGLSSHAKPDRFGENAIWNVLKGLGFSTMMGFDGCAFKARRMMGYSPGVDHLSQTFFCAAWKFAQYRSAKRGTNLNQRCIADHMSHWYLMNYTLAFSEIYNNTNQWVLGHYTAAHEETGQHAGTIDDDMVWYLQSYIEKFGETHNLFILLGADHGMRYGDFSSGAEAMQEHRLPAFFTIAKHDFLRGIPGVYDILNHNT
jgi:hypothetical protein